MGDQSPQISRQINNKADDLQASIRGNEGVEQLGHVLRRRWVCVRPRHLDPNPRARDAGVQFTSASARGCTARWSCFAARCASRSVNVHHVDLRRTPRSQGPRANCSSVSLAALQGGQADAQPRRSNPLGHRPKSQRIVKITEPPPHRQIEAVLDQRSHTPCLH